MAIGPGKYDSVCGEAARMVGIDDTTGGGVILIVIGGKLGNGFAINADIIVTKSLPDILRHMADQIEGDMPK